MINILVLEDDAQLNRLVCTHLGKKNYNAIATLNAQQAFDALYEHNIDLIISDIMMKGIDGFEFAESVRTQNKRIPIMFTSARDDFSAKEKGFRLGIDDYMVKPLDFEELLLRVAALLRRANIKNEKRIVLKSLELNGDERSAVLNGREIPLTAKEFDVLFKLLSYPKKTFTRVQLMDEFWAAESISTPRSVDVYITKLREKFSACTDFEIVTVHGLGYKAVIKNE